jgi:glycerol-1-phosphate dehydrogenase [NAD(P)+]
MVCDSATYGALGKRLVKELGIPFLMLEGRPSADMETVTVIRMKNAGAILAAGSGTINDLCKYASFLDGKPYAVFPTAPSMNGYCSANASITAHGHKQTLKAHLPKGVFCDLSVLAAAPPRLIRSGLGDSLCRPTAQADWLLSHLLFGTPYDPLPFSLLAPYERELLEHAGKLLSGDTQTIELLIRALLVSGLGMVMAGGSYPASQGEHLIAHTMEMKHGDTLPATYHGEQIGVTTLVMADIQRQALAKKLQVRRMPDPDKTIAAYFGAGLEKSVSQAYHAKRLLYEQYDRINERLQTEGSAIRDAISAVTLPDPVLRNALQKAAAPTTAAALGWHESDLQSAIQHAKFIRDRFTFLDVYG